MAALFAATYPERTSALLMYGSYARRTRSDDYPWGPTPEAHEAYMASIESNWGTDFDIENRAPTLARTAEGYCNLASLVTLVVFQLIVYATLGLGYAIYRAVVPEGELYTADSLDPTQLQGRVLPLLLIFTSLLFVLRKADGHAHSLIGSMSYIGDATGHVVRSTRRALGAVARRGPRIQLGSSRGRLSGLQTSRTSARTSARA